MPNRRQMPAAPVPEAPGAGHAHTALAKTRNAAPAPQTLEPRTLDGARQPLYVSLARALLRDIDSGRYAVGSSLPPEDQLGQRFGVSRHTVRQALRELKEEGVIWARPGIGTKVRARPQTARFFSGINSISDLLQFIDTTEMRVTARREVIADEVLAAQLQCPAGQAWAEITILRRLQHDKQLLNYLQVYLRPEFGDAVGKLKVLRQPVYSLVEARHGVRITEVLQDVTAAGLTAEMAKALNAVEGQPALRITRLYLDRKGSVVLVGIGHYPSGRYTQRTRFLAHADANKHE